MPIGVLDMVMAGVEQTLMDIQTAPETGQQNTFLAGSEHAQVETAA